MNAAFQDGLHCLLKKKKTTFGTNCTWCLFIPNENKNATLQHIVRDVRQFLSHLIKCMLVTATLYIFCQHRSKLCSKILVNQMGFNLPSHIKLASLYRSLNDQLHWNGLGRLKDTQALNVSCKVRFPTMCCLRFAKPQTSLRICAV